jgi:hypothetical protein
MEIVTFESLSSDDLDLSVDPPTVRVVAPLGPCDLLGVTLLREFIGRRLAEQWAFRTSRGGSNASARGFPDACRDYLQYAGGGLFEFRGDHFSNGDRGIYVGLRAHLIEQGVEWPGPQYLLNLVWLVGGVAGTDGVGGSDDAGVLLDAMHRLYRDYRGGTAST